MKHIALILGLVLGNFLWQALTQQNYIVATERSYFQAVAVLLAWWIL